MKKFKTMKKYTAGYFPLYGEDKITETDGKESIFSACYGGQRSIRNNQTGNVINCWAGVAQRKINGETQSITHQNVIDFGEVFSQWVDEL